MCCLQLRMRRSQLLIDGMSMLLHERHQLRQHSLTLLIQQNEGLQLLLVCGGDQCIGYLGFKDSETLSKLPPSGRHVEVYERLNVVHKQLGRMCAQQQYLASVL